jgi:hypothetical protein
MSCRKESVTRLLRKDQETCSQALMYAGLRAHWIQTFLKTRALKYLGYISFMFYLTPVPSRGSKSLPTESRVLLAVMWILCCVEASGIILGRSWMPSGLQV